jgi:3,4-dihydroxy 2-butanone 4-phosphate synthase/GTP cyclohydrolase II
VGAQILGDLGATRIRLITNNPAKYGGLEGYGLTITGRVHLPTVETPHNVRYLRTKRERMGHLGSTAHGSPSGSSSSGLSAVLDLPVAGT